MTKRKEPHEDLLKALEDIARGNVGVLPSMDDMAAFRYEMLLWSQERARDAIAAFHADFKWL